MNLIFIWFLAYVLPAGLAGGVIKFLPKRRVGALSQNGIIMHAALLVSILASQYALYALGFSFPWGLSALPVLFYLFSVFIAFLVLGAFGIWYGLSAFIQQLTMLSIAFLLLSVFPIYLVVLFVVPIYAFCHLGQVKRGLIRLLLFFLWGTASIMLFEIFHNVWLIVALHTFLGTLLIRQSVLYPGLKLKLFKD